MSLRPSALALDQKSETGMYVVIDDPDAAGPLLIPCSWAHRRTDVSRNDLTSGRFEIHGARAEQADPSREDLIEYCEEQARLEAARPESTSQMAAAVYSHLAGALRGEVTLPPSLK